MKSRTDRVVCTLIGSLILIYGKSSAAELAGGEDRALDLPALAHKARSAVVLLVGYDAAGKPTQTGSGFFVSAEGRIVTNFHVVDGVTQAQAKADNGAIYNIKGVLASSATLDLALLQADARNVQFLVVNNEPPLEPGTRIAVIGSPLALENTLSEGIVSAVRVTDEGSWIQISAPISHGSSGSPVLDRNGAVVGVATLTSENGQNLNFARSSRDLIEFLHSVQSDAKPRAFVSANQRGVLSDVDFQAAHKANQEKDGAKALELLNTLSRTYPNDDTILFERAEAQYYVGLYEESFFGFRKYVNAHPTDDSGWNNMALSALNSGRISEAVNAAQQAIKLNADNQSRGELCLKPTPQWSSGS